MAVLRIRLMVFLGILSTTITLLLISFSNTDPLKDINMHHLDMYSEALARGLTGIIAKTPGFRPSGHVAKENLVEIPFEYIKRENGKDWPKYGSTMAGLKRQLSNRDLLIDIEKRSIEGDIVEAGVWRGGSSIFMRGILNFIGSNRKSWMFDSYEGLPENVTSHDYDYWSKMDFVASPLEEVKENFVMANVSMENVEFIKGFHNDTFPGILNGTIPLKKIAILRMDSDMWESSMDILFHTWDIIEVGGWVINDDGHLPADKAIQDFAKMHGFEFSDKMKLQIDNNAYYFQKTKEMDVAVKYQNYFRLNI